MSFDLYFGTEFLRRLDAALDKRAARTGIELNPAFSEKKRAAVVREIMAAEPALPDSWEKLWLLIQEVDGRWRWKIEQILAAKHVDPVRSDAVLPAVLAELVQLAIRRAKDWASSMDEAASLAAGCQGLFNSVSEALVELGAALPDDVKARIALRKGRDLMDGLSEEVAEVFKRRTPQPDAWEDLNRRLFVDKEAALVRLFDIAWRDKQKRTSSNAQLQYAVWRVAFFVACKMQFSWDGKLRSRLFELTVRELHRQPKLPVIAPPPAPRPARQPALIEVPVEDGILVVEASPEEVPFGVARLSILTSDFESPPVRNVLIAIAIDQRHRRLRRRKLLLEDLVPDSDGDFIVRACGVTRDNLTWFQLHEAELLALLNELPAKDDPELQKSITELIELLRREHDPGHGRQ